MGPCYADSAVNTANASTRPIDMIGRLIAFPTVSRDSNLELIDFVREVMRGVTTSVVNLTGRLTLPELGELIRQAGCFFGVDSVPMHMAAAAGTPLVALFGPSNQAIWAPKGPGATVLSSSRRECLPCMKHGCGNAGYSECLEDLTVERVLDEVMGRFHSRR